MNGNTWNLSVQKGSLQIIRTEISHFLGIFYDCSTKKVSFMTKWRFSYWLYRNLLRPSCALTEMLTSVTSEHMHGTPLAPKPKGTDYSHHLPQFFLRKVVRSNWNNNTQAWIICISLQAQHHGLNNFCQLKKTRLVYRKDQCTPC